MSLLRIDEITKAYKQSRKSDGFAVRSISLGIHPGESFAILGPSGCGKTTLLKLVAGLLRPDEGKIILGDSDVTPTPPEQRGFGMVFQQPLLFPHMTVIENVAFGLKMQEMGKRDRTERAREVIGAVGLHGYDRRFPGELSGGQQQRVSLARAIVTHPQLLLLDEPFSALDPGIRGEMRELVKEIHRRFRITMLLVTHDRDEAFELADRIAIMNEGKVLQTGTPMDVYLKPNSPAVAKFIGAGNVLEGEVINGMFRSKTLIVEMGHTDSISLGPGWLVVRPESFRIVSKNEQRIISGVVSDLKFKQGFYQLRVDAEDISLEVTEKLHGVQIPQIGDSISLDLDASQVHFIQRTH